ncbi:MAG: hypothetical protein U9N83_08570, partial [Thermodesulfobacteriota bacterium]|nr:hypothetical protein [Thermodesulfobacteriota bacterium]
HPVDYSSFITLLPSFFPVGILYALRKSSFYKTTIVFVRITFRLKDSIQCITCILHESEAFICKVKILVNFHASTAAGLKSGQFNRKKNFLVSYEIQVLTSDRIYHR